MQFINGLRKNQIDESAGVMIDDPAKQFDDLGRLIRWKRKFEAVEDNENTFECCPNVEKQHH